MPQTSSKTKLLLLILIVAFVAHAVPFFKDFLEFQGLYVQSDRSSLVKSKLRHNIDNTTVASSAAEGSHVQQKPADAFHMREIDRSSSNTTSSSTLLNETITPTPTPTPLPVYAATTPLQHAADPETRQPTQVPTISPIIADDCSNLDNVYDVVICIHNSTAPARSAGKWVYRPDDEPVLSQEHLKCLDQERQGNCHDEDAWRYSKDKAKRSRHERLRFGGVVNSPGILKGHDPWVWESNLTLYQTIPVTRGDIKSYASVLKTIWGNNNSTTKSKLYLVGDSLTRQWAQTIRCELMHVLNRTEKEVKKQLVFLLVFDASRQAGRVDALLKFQPTPTQNDFVIWNTGHHVTPSKYKKGGWIEAYEKNMEQLHNVSAFAAVPDNHIFFRTTSVRHFWSGRGDWNTATSQIGGIAPDMDIHWDAYGGNFNEQPQQNQIALNYLRRQGRFNVLDVSPMMLARADASFDGMHFCLPGPMKDWTRMLYYQIQKIKLSEMTS